MIIERILRELLEIKNLTWNLPDGTTIVNDISFRTNGKLTVITGPNGGGKTSLAKLISGVEQPTAGSILLDGEDITALDLTERAKKGVAYAFQQPVRFKWLAGRDLIELAAGGSMNETELCGLLGKVG
ncbi:MAG: ATP-binding cassette domain-containing protein, partial [Oscillospiraceae bacterium]|nr:ATP-binding cassette domain-containing protein [Oscillospiraceae bacterium]